MNPMGLGKNFFPNGKPKCSSTYVNGKKEGERVCLDEKGAVISKEFYKNGVKTN
jgi:antitoxin component YwqK of YwqJK toxin-antitoxin module